jgi:hypothetical protein
MSRIDKKKKITGPRPIAPMGFETEWTDENYPSIPGDEKKGGTIAMGGGVKFNPAHFGPEPFQSMMTSWDNHNLYINMKDKGGV